MLISMPCVLLIVKQILLPISAYEWKAIKIKVLGKNMIFQINATTPFFKALVFAVHECTFRYWWSVASFAKEVNPQLAERPLETNGSLANHGLTSLVKEATGVYLAQSMWQYYVYMCWHQVSIHPILPYMYMSVQVLAVIRIWQRYWYQSSLLEAACCFQFCAVAAVKEV